MHKSSGKTGSNAKRVSTVSSRMFRVMDHLKTDAERAAYLEALLEEGDSRLITIAGSICSS